MLVLKKVFGWTKKILYKNLLAISPTPAAQAHYELNPTNGLQFGGSLFLSKPLNKKKTPPQNNSRKKHNTSLLTTSTHYIHHSLITKRLFHLQHWRCQWLGRTRRSEPLVQIAGAICRRGGSKPKGYRLISSFVVLIVFLAVLVDVGENLRYLFTAYNSLF